MARTETAQLIVSLLDKVTAPARKAAEALRGIGSAAQGVNGTLSSRLSAALERNQRQMDRMRGRMLDAVASAYALQRALAAPVNAALKFETSLEDIGQKADLGGDKLRALGDQIRAIAKATGRGGSETASTFDELLGLGLGGKTDAENVQAALGMMPAINKVATAYRAASDDIARAGQAVFANLKVPAEQVISAFDAMAKSGKEGAFELRDMARYFPSITAMAANLGIKGVKGAADLAAALQVVRQGAGNAEEAATNLINVLQKASTPATQKAFKKVGIDFRKELDKAVAGGKSPIEAMAELTEKALKKKGVKIGDLFEDRQAQLGILALLADMQRYRQIREEALKATGEVEEDFQRRMKTSQARVDRFNASMENLAISVGNALLPALTSLADAVRPFVDRVAELADRFPRATSAIVSAVAGLVSLRIASAAAGFGMATLRGGALVGALGLARIGSAAALLANPFRLLPALIRGVGVALRFAFVSTGVGAIIAGIAAAGVAIYNNWDGIGEMFKTFGSSFMAALGPARPAIEGFASAVSTIFDKVMGLLGPLDESGASWRAWGATLGEIAGGGVASLVSGIQKIAEAIGWVIDKANAGAQAISNFFSAAGNAPAGKPVLGTSSPAAGRWGPAGLNQDTATGRATGPGRASGGPVHAGGLYQVNEFGKEFFVPSQDGTIFPARQMAAGQLGSGRREERARPPSMGPLTITNHFSISGGGNFDTDFQRAVDRMTAELRREMRTVFADYGLDFA